MQLGLNRQFRIENIITLSSPFNKEGIFILLLECSNIKKYFGDRLIIDLPNLKIYSEDRIGIVGVNGSGKTTLLNILSQNLQPDQGWVRLYADCSYITQFDQPESKIISPEMASRFSVKRHWNDAMSGGEKTRFKIAQSLSHNSLMIFADEPTSNMDMEGIELMENLFAHHQGALLLISHDRSLLDRLCNKILEIENGRITIYKGNYSEYRVVKDREKEWAQFEYEQYVNEKKRLEEALTETKQKSRSVRKAPKRMGNSEARLHKMGDQNAKSSLDKAANRIRSRIDHLEAKERPVTQKNIELNIADAGRLYSRIIIEGEHLNKSYGDKLIFRDARFAIPNGAKVAFIGPNGCGKSTLLKMIMDHDIAIKVAQRAKVGYFSQDMNILEENLTILEDVMKGSIYPETFVRIFLARLLFKREDVYKPINVLSGGERVKVSFAKILLQDINLLILDEPTNYLDINSIEVIEEALKKYDRTLLFVSHDRSFLSSIASHIMTIENHAIQMFKGGYEEYLKKKSRVADKNIEDIQEQIYILQHRLSEIIGRLSMPSKKDDLQQLDQEYHLLREELKRLTAMIKK
jgi:macrolide transport system ATP-binding/permease protein